jgi:hypothetical protein
VATKPVLVDVAIVLFYLCGSIVVVRAVKEGHFARYAFFHSYLVFLLVTGLVGLGIRSFIPRYFPYYFWLHFLTVMIAEFALLVQIGDHVLTSYPALRSLGRLLTLGITLAFSVAFILPPLLEVRPRPIAIFDLVKRSALTKGFILFLLVALAGYLRIPLGRNITGIAAGLMAYLAINTANFALAERLGRADYGQVFSIIGPWSQTLMVLIWAVGLWKYEPVGIPSPLTATNRQQTEEPLLDRLDRYNNTLNRMIRR